MGDLGDTILLVEDDEEVNRFATEVLREEGYNVIATHDARSALRLLDANPGIKLLFTDIILPGEHEWPSALRRSLRRRPDLKVLHATGYTRDAIIHEGRLDSDVELLNKPFTHDLLTRKVRQILDADREDAETGWTETSGCTRYTKGGRAPRLRAERVKLCVAHRADLVAFGIAHIGAVIIRMIMRAQAGRALVTFRHWQAPRHERHRPPRARAR